MPRTSPISRNILSAVTAKPFIPDNVAFAMPTTYIKYADFLILRYTWFDKEFVFYFACEAPQ